MSNEKKNYTVEEKGTENEQLEKKLQAKKQKLGFRTSIAGFILFLIVVFCSVWFPSQTPQKKMQEDVKAYVIAVTRNDALAASAVFSHGSDKGASDEFTAYYNSDVTKAFLDAFASKNGFIVDQMYLTSETEGGIFVTLKVPDFSMMVEKGIFTKAEADAVFGGAADLLEVLKRPGSKELFLKMKAGIDAGTLPLKDVTTEVKTLLDKDGSGKWKMVYGQAELLSTVGDWTVLK